MLRPLRPRTALAVAACAVLVAGCGQASAGESDAEVSAVATTTHVADMVRKVAGDRGYVEQFLEPGSDPHEYEPRPSDAAAVAEADVVFRSGGDLDSWLDGVIENAGGDPEVVTLLDTPETVEGKEHGHAHEEEGHDAEEPTDAQEQDDAADPHWWQDPRNGAAAVEAIADALASADPAGAETYRRNAGEYAAELRRLDRQIARCMRGIPEEQRKLVTTHDSYGYFARRYGIEVIGALIPSQSTQAQPSAGEIDALVEQLRSEDVGAIFPESSLDPALERAVAEEAGVEVGDPLWADSLGPEGSSGETYLDALAADATALAEGFVPGAADCRIGA